MQVVGAGERVQVVDGQGVVGVLGGFPGGVAEGVRCGGDGGWDGGGRG